MMGVAADDPGSDAFQATPCVFENSAGRFFSSVDPSKCGPRQCGQLLAWEWVTKSGMVSNPRRNFMRLLYEPDASIATARGTARYFGQRVYNAGAVYSKPCASATALWVTLPFITFRPPMRAGCFWQ